MGSGSFRLQHTGLRCACILNKDGTQVSRGFMPEGMSGGAGVVNYNGRIIVGEAARGHTGILPYSEEQLSRFEDSLLGLVTTLAAGDYTRPFGLDEDWCVLINRTKISVCFTDWHKADQYSWQLKQWTERVWRQMQPALAA